MDYNVTGISSFGNATIRVHSIKGVNWSFYTMNFLSIITILTTSAWVDIGTHSNMVTNFEAVNIGTNLFHDSCYLMSIAQVKIYQFKDSFFFFFFKVNILLKEEERLIQRMCTVPFQRIHQFRDS